MTNIHEAPSNVEPVLRQGFDENWGLLKSEFVNDVVTDPLPSVIYCVTSLFTDGLLVGPRFFPSIKTAESYP